MSVSSEIKKANGLVSHSHKLIQLSSKTSQKLKNLRNLKNSKKRCTDEDQSVKLFFDLTVMILSLCTT